MSNVIKFSIDGDTNAEQVTERAKAAVSGFDKTVDGIQKKFGNFGRDLFLSIAAPMVILNQVISMISASIEKSRQDAQAGIDLMAKGETMYATSEEKKMAAFFKAKAAREQEQKEVSEAREKLAREFSNTEAGQKATRQYIKENPFAVTMAGSQVSYEAMFKSLAFQNRMVQEFIKTPEGAAYKPIFENKNKDGFKPEGLSSNIIGVGQSPYMAAMNEQTRLQAEILRKLEEFDAREREKIISQPSGTPFKLKPEYSVPAYPQFK
jgi:ElaB/YqjD/DUF883 family membrane-anchored ribosome-binding protein